ncbi:hypothetical protein [uncultured Pseudacidovorax sp.]|uniref:hypothetical protein n=1 Tax=uncultured Pseudacidovorax sp. TaxID=679313 RepID=UPI0025F15044|nr:hypothetical protein [uncultured Pseudacidovorax sp.]
MFYSPSTGGFYLPEIHGAGIPGDAVEISAEQHADLLAGQAAGLCIVAQPDGSPALAPLALTEEERRARLAAAVQQHLDDSAKALGYDDIRSAVTYADEPAVPKFQAEGRALRAWRSEVWAACYALLARWTAGEVAEPSAADVLAALPTFPGVATA